jgi:methylglyoxal synthase
MPDIHDGRARRWRVALIAHEAQEGVLASFILRHRAAFASFELAATAATAEVVRDTAGLRPRPLLPSHRGGDAQVGAEIATGEVDALIFVRDPLTARPHEPDPTPLVRLADIHRIPVATNLATAECLVRALAPEPQPAGLGPGARPLAAAGAPIRAPRDDSPVPR